MRYLILSDIHSNKESLEAVLDHAEGDYDEIGCLGDIVGYGADPNAVTEWIRENVSHVIRGNHDKACCGLEDASTFNVIARLAVQWTQENLTPENREYLTGLSRGPLVLNGFVMVHGSIIDEDEYVIDPYDAMMQYPYVEGRLVFFGHTHLQGGFILWGEDGHIAHETVGPDSGEIQTSAGRSYLINPGSVGQPRDFNWKAGYAIFDSEKQVVEYRRCPYAIETTQAKIRDAGLPGALATRLSEGR